MLGEIVRLTGLRESTKETFGVKMMIPRMLFILMEEGSEKPESMKICEAYYEALDIHLQNKLEFWNYCIQGEIPTDMLEKLQESLNDWLETGWAYLGQENIEEESEQAKEEFQMFKGVCKALKPNKSKTKTKAEKRTERRQRGRA